RRRLEIIVEPGKRYPENFRQLEDARGADTSLSDFIFLNLLGRHVDDLGEPLEAHTPDLSQQSEAPAYVLVDGCRFAGRYVTVVAASSSKLTGRLTCNPRLRPSH